jgi:hypothetical protein
MFIQEKPGDLFAVDNSFFLAHCISADAKMGAGIARRFVREFPALAGLRGSSLVVGGVYPVDRVFNLVTKDKYFEKPTYKTLGFTLDVLVGICVTQGVSRLAMPRIGCGLDRLSWTKVRPMIEDRFLDLPIEIAIRFF